MTWDAYDLGIASCVVCNKPQSEWDPKWSHSAKTCTEDCFIAHFWYPKFVYRLRGDIAIATNPAFLDQVVVRFFSAPGVLEHMMCVPDVIYSRTDPGFLGHGGAMWYFRFVHGPHAFRVIRSNNVWSQGRVPNEWQPLLPPNAIQITKEEYDAEHPAPTVAHSGG